MTTKAIYNLELGPLNLKNIQNFPWQDRAAEEVVRKLKGWHKGDLLRAGTGIGKTYIVAKALRKLLVENALEPLPGSLNFYPIVYVIPDQGVIQLRRVLYDFGIAGKVMVLNYNEFRSDKNPMMSWIKNDFLDEDGEISYRPVWKPEMLPALIVVDECQAFRHESAQQTQVFLAIPKEVKVLAVTATPYEKISKTTYFLLGCGVTTPYNSLVPTIHNVKKIQKEIAYPKDPDELSPSAMKRFREATKDFVTEVKGVHFKHKAKSSCIRETFRRPQCKIAYDNAFEEYLAEKAKLGQAGPSGVRAQWVALLKFRQKAELLRADILAERAFNAVTLDGKQSVVASNFRQTIRAVYALLTRPKSKGGLYEIDKSRIGWIVGGQKQGERQIMIDKFQRGELDWLLAMMRAGGVSISLHHEAKYPKARPRRVTIPPTYHAIELAQMLGRCARLTSCSDTEQEIIWIAGTVEDKVAAKVATKLRCLQEAIVAKEQFGSLFSREDEESPEEETEEQFTILNSKEDGDSKTTTESQEEELLEEEGITGEGLSNE